MFGSSNSVKFWKDLTSEAQLDEIIQISHNAPVVLFKHSTRCIISKMAKSRFEESYENNISPVDCYLLDLLSFRDVSNAIATKLNVTHQSPQVIVLKNGAAIHHDSHEGISGESVAAALNS